MIRKSYRKHAKPEKKIYARNMRNNPTESESILWSILGKKRLGVKFRRQAIIYGWIVDFYSPDIGLVIEVDGAYHKMREYEDKRRSDKIKTIGVKILRFTNEEVMFKTEEVIKTIKDFIDSKTNKE